MSSLNTVPFGIDFVYRIQSEYPTLVMTGGNLVIGSRLTAP